MKFYARIICILGLIFVIRFSSAGIEFPRIRRKQAQKSKAQDCSPWSCMILHPSPVCGSDGKTYRNKCILKQTAACDKSKKDLDIASEKSTCSGNGRLPRDECPKFNPPGCNNGNGCKDGEVCCSCAPCYRRDMCSKTSCQGFDWEVPEKCYKNKNTTQDSEENAPELAFLHFRAIDNDKNGKITLEELNASRQHPASVHPNGSKFDIKKEFERMDDDKNGVITLHEVESVIYSQNQTQNKVDFKLADVGASECKMRGWTSIKTLKECKVAQLKLKKTHRLFKNSKFVNASGNGTELPFGCIWDNVSGGKEKHVYMNLDGNTISKDPKLRAICKKDKSDQALNECKNKPCGELCFDDLGMCDGNGFCVDGLLNPCAVHGCDGKKCGDECLSGDIMGWCDKDLYCDYYRKPCEEAEFTNCLGNLDKKLPEQCQISRSEGKKCQEWLRNNRNTFEKTLDPCLQQLNGQKHNAQRLFLHGTPASCKACLASASARCPYLSKKKNLH